MNQKKLDDDFYHVLKEVNETTRFKETKAFVQHGKTSVYEHAIEVAYMSYKIANRLRIRRHLRSLIIGALLHDYFLYDWHDREHRFHGFLHPLRAYHQAKRDIELDEISKDIILKHMFPLTIVPPRYIESWIVTFSDKVCTIKEIYGAFSRKIQIAK